MPVSSVQGRNPAVQARHRAAVTLFGLAGLSAIVIGLAGCSTGTVQSTSSPSSSPNSTSSAASTPTSTAGPVFEPKGTAAQNMAFFDTVNRRTIASEGSPSGTQFMNALIAAGFPKNGMQVTADKTTIGLTPASIEFAVLINGGCLVGQYGASIGGYHSEVVAPVATGKCFIGNTAAWK